MCFITKVLDSNWPHNSITLFEIGILMFPNVSQKKSGHSRIF